MALPALLSGLGRQLAVQGAKGAARGTAKKMLGGRRQEKNSNDIVKQQERDSVGYKKSSALVPTLKPIDFGAPSSSPEVSSSTKGDDSSLLSIKEKVIKIENLLGEQYKNRKKQAEKQRKLSERAGRKEKEERLEETSEEKKNKGKFNIPIPGKGLFDNLMSRVFNFLFWIAIGKILPTILKFLPQIIGFVKVIGKVMDAIINVAGFILDGFITFVDFGFKVYDKIRGFAGAIGGEGLVKVLDGFTSAVETLLNILFIISMANAVGGGFGGGKNRGGGRGGQRPGTRPGQGFRPKVTTTGGRGANRPDIRNPLRDRPRVTTTGGGTAGRPDIRNPVRTRPTVTTGAGREIIEGAGKKAAGEAAEQITKKTALLAVGKFIQPVTKRIPIFGALIDFAINIALGESVGRAASRAVGSGIGSAIGAWAGGALAGAAGSVVPFLGTAIGGAVGVTIGGVLGGMLGDWVGGLIYDNLTGSSKPSEEKPKVEAKSNGGMVLKFEEGGEVVDGEESKVEESKTAKFKLRKLPISHLSDSDIDSDKLAKIYKPEGVLKIIELANDLKSVPIVGGAMYAALSLALGNDVDQNVTKSIAYDLVSFSNLDSFENISSSISGLESIIAMNTGGEVSKMVAESSSDSEQSATSLSIFLDRKFNSQEIGKVTEEDEKNAKQKPWWDLFGTTEENKDKPTDGSTDGPGSISGNRDSATGAYTPSSGGNAGGGIYDPILDLIARYESGSGGYEAMYPGTTLPGATKMTIAEVAEKATGAVGMYQNMPRYLIGRAKAVGLDPNTALYDEENQRKIAVYLIEEGQANVTPQMLKDDPDEAMIRLARVWAAIPVPKDMQGHAGPIKKGQSYYSGVGSNKAHITPEMMYQAMGSSVKLQQEQQSAQTTSVPQSEPPGQTPSTSSSSNERGEGSKLAGELGRFIKTKLKSPENFSQVHRHPEHPPWGRESGHSANSLHYESQGARAIDIGAYTYEQQPILDVISQFNKKKGVNPVELLHGKNEPNYHHNHVHVAYEGGGLIRPKGSMSVPNSFASYNSPKSNTKVVMVPVPVPVSKPQMSPVLENSMGGFVEFGEVNSMSSRMNPIHQTSRS